MLTALLLPVVLFAAGIAVDYGRQSNQQDKLQEMADLLALRGAREFLLANANAGQIENMLKSVAASEVRDIAGVGAYSLDVLANKGQSTVTVTLTQVAVETFLLSNFTSASDGITVTAMASASGGVKVCVVALEESSGKAIEANWNATLTADDCSILSNSGASDGIRATGNSKLTAAVICSAGGADGGNDNFDPAATSNCPIYEDPLSARPEPPVGPCDYFDAEYGEPGTLATAVSSIASMLSEEPESEPGPPRPQTTLDPGVYCGGLKVNSNIDVVLNPGIYVMKDGQLKVSFDGGLFGENVGVFMIGDDATFVFAPESEIDLTAPASGLMAGILFFESRSAPVDRVHRIISDDARVLLGTIYLPRGHLEIASLTPVADQSAYTAIVARRLRMNGSPTLVLNSDYAATNIPVPDGIGPIGGEVRLRN